MTRRPTRWMLPKRLVGLVGLARWARRCPPGWQITRAVSENDGGPVQAHIDACPFCSVEYRRLREVALRATALSASDGLSYEATQAISSRLLSGQAPSSARPRSRRFVGRPLLLGAMGAVVLAATSWGIVGVARRGSHRDASTSTPASTVASRSVSAPPLLAPTPPSPSRSPSETAPRSRASIRAVAAARFSRVTSPPDERIVLQEGVIVLDVVPLVGGERFRVITEDAEVEVRGTHFEVSAAHGRLVAVRVTTGRVQVKSTGGALATLDAGDEWVVGRGGVGRSGPVPQGVAAPSKRSSLPNVLNAPNASNVPNAPNAPSAPKASVARQTQAPEVRPTQAVTASFDNAWSLLRKGDTQAAALAFAEVERTAAGGSLEEDAAYWRAVAVARSGDSAMARRLFDAFLRRFPASARRGEASVALGWLLLDGGQPGEARSAFERAVSDPSPSVRASASQGLNRAIRR